eukprot:1157441-Pelagomonas_calceolata.AAC.12
MSSCRVTIKKQAGRPAETMKVACCMQEGLADTHTALQRPGQDPKPAQLPTNIPLLACLSLHEGFTKARAKAHGFHAYLRQHPHKKVVMLHGALLLAHVWLMSSACGKSDEVCCSITAIPLVREKCGIRVLY